MEQLQFGVAFEEESASILFLGSKNRSIIIIITMIIKYHVKLGFNVGFIYRRLWFDIHLWQCLCRPAQILDPPLTLRHTNVSGKYFGNECINILPFPFPFQFGTSHYTCSSSTTTTTKHTILDSPFRNFVLQSDHERHTNDGLTKPGEFESIL